MMHNRITLRIIRKIRAKIVSLGYQLEQAIVPLQHQYSVVANKGDKIFNVRLDKETFELKETSELFYRTTNNNKIVKVIRIVSKHDNQRV